MSGWISCPGTSLSSPTLAFSIRHRHGVLSPESRRIAGDDDRTGGYPSRQDPYRRICQDLDGFRAADARSGWGKHPMVWSVDCGHNPEMRNYPYALECRSGTLILFAPCALALFLGCLASSGQALTSTSLPVACFQIEVLPRSQVLVSLAFEPYAASIAGILGAQLAGGSVLKWNSTHALYQTAHHGPDGHWYTDETFVEPSAMTVSAGDGFWLRNNGDIAQVVCLVGGMVDHETAAFTYPPALVLAGTPFEAYRTFTNAAVGQIWRLVPDEGTKLLRSTGVLARDEQSTSAPAEFLNQSPKTKPPVGESILATR